jgi:hypothetical protein
MNVYGFREKKIQHFGSAILKVVAQYMNSMHMVKQEGAGAAHAHRSTQPRTTAYPTTTTLSSQNDVSLNDIEVGETLTVEQIVNNKFNEAERNGEMITLD